MNHALFAITTYRHLRRLLPIIFWGVVINNPVFANPQIAVLAIELDDVSVLPRTPQELARTASFKPLLEAALIEGGNIEIMPINTKTVATENAGFGYLFKFHDLAAKLGQSFHADWVVLGQHSKHSFLYSDLMVQLVNVKTQTLEAFYTLELKGNNAQVTQRAMQSLAIKIQKTLQHDEKP